jgi:hypothetical protein
MMKIGDRFKQVFGEVVFQAAQKCPDARPPKS